MFGKTFHLFTFISVLIHTSYAASIKDDTISTDETKTFLRCLKEFTNHLMDLNQEIRFAGVGAHHQNGPAEVHIGIVMKMARTMMLHAACDGRSCFVAYGSTSCCIS